MQLGIFGGDSKRFERAIGAAPECLNHRFHRCTDFWVNFGVGRALDVARAQSSLTFLVPSV
jgi:hypothetical protein